MEFKAYGHENISALHKTTLEFTKDDFVTPTGDCIVGIKADFEVPKEDLGKILISISAGDVTEQITARHNPLFDSHEMVIRKSDFLDKRTFAIKADKAAVDLSRDMIDLLKTGIKINIVVVKP